jgi:hypothetical protein
MSAETATEAVSKPDAVRVWAIEEMIAGFECERLGQEAESRSRRQSILQQIDELEGRVKSLAARREQIALGLAASQNATAKEALQTELSGVDGEMALSLESVAALRGDLERCPNDIEPSSQQKAADAIRWIARKAPVRRVVSFPRAVRAVFEETTLRLSGHDDHGRITECTLGIPDHCGGGIVKIAVTALDGVYMPEFVPSELKWLAATSGATTANKWQTDYAQDRALSFWWIEDEQRFILGRPIGKLAAPVFSKSEWEEHKKAWDEHRLREYEYSKWSALRDCGLESMREYIDQEVGADGVLDMKRRYKRGTLLSLVKASLRRLADDAVRYSRRTGVPSDEELAAEIGQDWERLRTCRWSGQASGSMAKLKWLLEERAKVAVWPGRYVGQAHFRMRTRDHTWLTGMIFVQTDQAYDGGAELVWVRGPWVHDQEYGSRKPPVYLDRGVWRLGRAMIQLDEDSD